MTADDLFFMLVVGKKNNVKQIVDRQTDKTKQPGNAGGHNFSHESSSAYCRQLSAQKNLRYTTHSNARALLLDLKYEDEIILLFSPLQSIGGGGSIV